MLVEDAFVNATRSDQTAYDCLYVALAAAANAQFITADERLAKALGSRHPIRWLDPR
jgi:predicted nucleic acid-binding protein